MFGLILPYATYFPMFLFIRFCGAVCNEAADLAAYGIINNQAQNYNFTAEIYKHPQPNLKKKFKSHI